MKNIGIIPLRAWSKRVPWKNTIIIWDKPLFCHTVDEVLTLWSIDVLIISTNDPIVKEIVNEKYNTYIEHGRIILHNRSEESATDKATTIDLIKTIIHTYTLSMTDRLVLLQATTPLRKANHIREALQLYNEMLPEWVVSVKLVNEHPWIQFVSNNEWYIQPLMEEKYLKQRSQDMPVTYIPNWGIYICNVDTFIRYNSFYPSNTLPYVMENEYSVDIDTINDIQYVEYLLTKSH